MHVGSVTTIIFLLLVSSTVRANDDRGHCKNEERVIFNCETGRKTISVCASETLTNQTGYMQYRFGKLNKIEMAFPRSHEIPGHKFYLSSTSYAGGGEAHLRFSVGRFEYIVYDSTRKGEMQPEGDRLNVFDAGVLVLKRGKVASNIHCLNPENASIHREAYEALERETFRPLELIIMESKGKDKDKGPPFRRPGQ